MKINKMFCIDEEIHSKLDGINASDLVNRLLREHFSDQTEQNLSVLKKKFDENKAILRESKRKDKQLRAFIDKIETKEKQIISITKGLTDEQVRILRGIEGEMTLIRWKYYRNQFIGYTFSQINTILKGGVK